MPRVLAFLRDAGPGRHEGPQDRRAADRSLANLSRASYPRFTHGRRERIPGWPAV